MRIAAAVLFLSFLTVSCAQALVKIDRVEEGVVCTMDAKICPDGSSVARQAPNCEFAACPGEAKDKPKEEPKDKKTPMGDHEDEEYEDRK